MPPSTAPNAPTFTLALPKALRGSSSPDFDVISTTAASLLPYSRGSRRSSPPLLHGARVSGLVKAWNTFVGQRHAVDDLLDLSVRAAHVDPAVLAGDEPGRGQQHGRAVARRRRRQLIDRWRRDRRDPVDEVSSTSADTETVS
jgi:hypothetical protein